VTARARCELCVVKSRATNAPEASEIDVITRSSRSAEDVLRNGRHGQGKSCLFYSLKDRGSELFSTELCALPDVDSEDTLPRRL
jgi:hypothetical protein